MTKIDPDFETKPLEELMDLLEFGRVIHAALHLSTAFFVDECRSYNSGGLRARVFAIAP